ncbi:uncharacterized protein LOC135212745 isoform X1 [Macrobrachium nipponense]|uniref:uncharacterized protein LOC135212745 isoform X1 n=1 Tax=Macrobrachium nipponense TaxID=159736 RepID=UPI0030C89673
MTDRLTNKLKGFFKGDGKADKSPVQLERGEHSNVEELRKWYSASSFTELDKKGQEAFFRFLRGDYYSEDEDISAVSVKAEGMEGDAMRYQFWVKCEALELEDLFDVYVIDDETKLKDVSESYKDREIMKMKASAVDKYVRTIKDRMKPDLDEKFSLFKKSLGAKIVES